MAENGDDKTGGNDNPYAFDPGSGFFANDGDEDAVVGTGGQVPVIDPAGNTDDGNRTVDTIGDAGSASGGSDNTTNRKPRSDRGRKRGPRSGSANQTVHLGGFEDAILAVHMALAGIAKCPELELDEDEAKKVTGALDRLAQHYDVQPSESAKVWINFAGAMASVYGPRAIAIKKRLESEGKLGKGGTNNVRPFPGAG